MKYECPNCKKHYEIELAKESLEYECDNCHERFTVPAVNSDRRLIQTVSPGGKKIKTPIEAIVLNIIGLLMLAASVILFLIAVSDNGTKLGIFSLLPGLVFGGVVLCGFGTIIRSTSRTAQATEQMLDLLRILTDRIQ